MEGIKMRFATKILREEWKDFEKRHRDVIKRKTTRRTGRLEDDRKYKVEKNSDAKSTASFSHPIYERFLDMRKNYMGDWKHRAGVQQDLMKRRAGIKIHNRIIYGKLNPISFRLMHDLKEEIINYTRKRLNRNNRP